MALFQAGTVKLDPGTGHARDMFAFGAVVDTLLEGLRDKGKMSCWSLLWKPIRTKVKHLVGLSCGSQSGQR